MPRWEPNARQRLEQAAIELFAEQGYDATTVEQIAEAAGLTRSTLFRHFRDKREILSGGHEGLDVRLGEVIRAADITWPPLQAVEAAFLDLEATWFPAERRHLAALRASVIAANPELRERELLKRVAITEQIGGALEERGLDNFSAAVTAHLATLAFSRAIALWAQTGQSEAFHTIAVHALRMTARTAAVIR